jgi:hypothetical protein
MAHINDSSTPPATDDSAELERAQREDALGKKVLEAAGRRGPMVMSTPESIRQGNEAMARAEQNAVATIAARIANLELISLGALQRAWREAPGYQQGCRREANLRNSRAVWRKLLPRLLRRRNTLPADTR